MVADVLMTHKHEGPGSFEHRAFNLNPAASYSSIGRPYSTIGAGGLNGRVRDGIGCDTSAIATGNFSSRFLVEGSRFLNPNPTTKPETSKLVYRSEFKGTELTWNSEP